MLDRARLGEARNAAVWVPQTGPQLDAFLSPADTLLYGGAAGGGKTHLAIGLALTRHQRTLFVREESIQLVAVREEIEKLLGTRDGYNGQDKIWKIADGRQIQFGGIPNLGDESKFQGQARDLLVIDEAANVRESQAKFLMGWVRTEDPKQRCRILLTSNPPTSADGDWLIEYFSPWLDESHPNPARPGELRWFATIAGKDIPVESKEPFEHDGEIIFPKSRTFIPSKVQDNRFYRNSGYIATLQAMPEPLRSQMLYGDFRAGRQDDVWQVIPSAWVKAAMERWENMEVRPQMDAMGVDVARGGADNTVLARRHALWSDFPITIPGVDTPNGRIVVGHIIQHQRNAAALYIDAIGVGSSVVDAAEDSNMEVIAIVGSASPTRMDRTGVLAFANMRSQIWWNMRELLDPAADIPIALPPDKDLEKDLTAPLFSQQSGKIVVEPKEKLVMRLGRSPDVGDAYCYAYSDTDETLTGIIGANNAVVRGTVFADKQREAWHSPRRRGRMGFTDPVPYKSW